MGGGDAELFAVFGDGSAGNSQALGLEEVLEFFVGEGGFGILLCDQVTESLFDFLVGEGLAGGGGEAG